MQEGETITQYSDRISLIVNRIMLLGENFKDNRIVEKVLVTIPERSESKISALEESKDLSDISLAELISVQQQKGANPICPFIFTKHTPNTPFPLSPSLPFLFDETLGSVASLSSLFSPKNGKNTEEFRRCAVVCVRLWKKFNVPTRFYPNNAYKHKGSSNPFLYTAAHKKGLTSFNQWATLLTFELEDLPMGQAGIKNQDHPFSRSLSVISSLHIP
ncbi:uncharacterized protein LOC132607982 [Lycium barbarum]|uniref:uncharacterized protein LOC132607982 n=1 Tax=Lycium barbarum TaxID=112863 RepID=UPI00293E378C|nr:uncharacterized protein LOC132607982 [Lycium barbarum]